MTLSYSSFFLMRDNLFHKYTICFVKDAYLWCIILIDRSLWWSNFWKEWHWAWRFAFVPAQLLGRNPIHLLQKTCRHARSFKTISSVSSFIGAFIAWLPKGSGIWATEIFIAMSMPSWPRDSILRNLMQRNVYPKSRLRVPNISLSLVVITIVSRCSIPRNPIMIS